jgi:hypothetical protein
VAREVDNETAMTQAPDRKHNDATAELLSVPGFEKAHATTLAEVARGDTVPFRQIRRDATCRS